MKYLLLLLTLCFVTGCIYKMPDDDYVATSPAVGNPQITQEKPSSLFPSR